MRENLRAARKYPMFHVLQYVKEVFETTDSQKVVDMLQEQKWIVVSARQSKNEIVWILGRIV